MPTITGFGSNAASTKQVRMATKPLPEGAASTPTTITTTTPAIAPKLPMLLSPPPRIIGGVSLEVAGLGIPPNLPLAEIHRRLAEQDLELENQRLSPPALPASRIEDLPDKPVARPWSTFPADITPERRREIEQENNQIAAENQKVERERNNAAAKKSRLKRLEALDNTRTILDRKAAECDWWKLRAIALGATGSEWLLVPQHAKEGMVLEIQRRVKEVHDQHEEFKKTVDASKRASRNSARAVGF